MGMDHKEGERMTLQDQTLFGVIDKERIAIERLRVFEPKDGYYLAFSGGKDSITIKHLANLAGVKYDAHYSVTTIDPPELVQYIREHHPDVSWNKPPKHLTSYMIDQGFPPTRIIRWCCKRYKEQGGSGRLVVTGIRWAESVRRKNRRKMTEHCMRDKSRTFLNVIIDWQDVDVWEFIHKYKLPYCRLYDEGFTRLGCVMCPMGGKDQVAMQSQRWPKIAEKWKRAFKRLWEKREASGKPFDKWGSWQEMYDWWILGEAVSNDDPDQEVLFE